MGELLDKIKENINDLKVEEKLSKASSSIKELKLDEKLSKAKETIIEKTQKTINTEVRNMDRFCDKCGKELISGICPDCTNQVNVNYSKGSEDNFISPTEKLVCKLGNGYVQNLVAAAGIGSTYSVVSDKRVYFFGKIYEASGNVLRKKKISKIFDLRDVTGTSVQTKSKISYLIWSLLVFIIAISFFIEASVGADFLVPFGVIGIIISIIFIIMYFLKKITLLTIETAGGIIAFNIRWFSNQECENYQKMIRLAKDKVIEDTNHLTVEAINKLMSHSN